MPVELATEVLECAGGRVELHLLAVDPADEIRGVLVVAGLLHPLAEEVEDLGDRADGPADVEGDVDSCDHDPGLGRRLEDVGEVLDALEELAGFVHGEPEQAGEPAHDVGGELVDDPPLGDRGELDARTLERSGDRSARSVHLAPQRRQLPGGISSAEALVDLTDAAQHLEALGELGRLLHGREAVDHLGGAMENVLVAVQHRDAATELDRERCRGRECLHHHRRGRRELGELAVVVLDLRSRRPSKRSRADDATLDRFRRGCPAADADDARRFGRKGNLDEHRGRREAVFVRSDLDLVEQYDAVVCRLPEVGTHHAYHGAGAEPTDAAPRSAAARVHDLFDGWATVGHDELLGVLVVRSCAFAGCVRLLIEWGC